VFEAVHSERTSAEAAAIWALWADPGRWPEWNEQIERAELEDGELRVGAAARVKYKRGGTVKLELTALESERLLVHEARFPGARVGHEHRISPGAHDWEITHRLYVHGPLSGFWAPMLGRKRMRESVASFAERERELVEQKGERDAARRR